MDSDWLSMLPRVDSCAKNSFLFSGGGDTSVNSNLTLDKKIFPDSLGGTSEPQCHVDPKFQLNLKNRGFLFSVFQKLEMYVFKKGRKGR